MNVDKIILKLSILEFDDKGKFIEKNNDAADRENWTTSDHLDDALLCSTYNHLVTYNSDKLHFYSFDQFFRSESDLRWEWYAGFLLGSTYL